MLEALFFFAVIIFYTILIAGALISLDEQFHKWRERRADRKNKNN